VTPKGKNAHTHSKKKDYPVKKKRETLLGEKGLRPGVGGNVFESSVTGGAMGGRRTRREAMPEKSRHSTVSKHKAGSRTQGGESHASSHRAEENRSERVSFYTFGIKGKTSAIGRGNPEGLDGNMRKKTRGVQDQNREGLFTRKQPIKPSPNQ